MGHGTRELNRPRAGASVPPPRDPLRRLLGVLTRPIEFASRDGYARISTVKNLGRLVSDQVVRALADRVHPPPVEADLLALRQLFCDYDDGTGPEERKHRLAAAGEILGRLAVEAMAPAAARPPGPSLRVAEPTATPSPSAAPPAPVWDLPIRYARGVGPKRAALLERVGVRTVEDLLWFLPWRYEDRSALVPIGRLTPGARATVCGRVGRCEAVRTRRRGFTIVQATVEDGTGRLVAVFFNQSYLEKLLAPGATVMLSGTVTTGRGGWTDLRMESPHYEVLDAADEAPIHVGRIVPIYHETRGLTSRLIRAMVKAALDQYGASLEDVIPAAIRRRQGLPPLGVAMREVHFPAPGEDAAALDRGTTQARRRLAFEELLLLEVGLALRQREVKTEVKGIRFDVDTPLLDRLRALLPFRLTPAQARVVAEIRADMAAARPMNRLLQGDVGCGKTVVALHAIVVACGSGYQAALMAPTEILAEQHYLNLRESLRALGLETVLLKSGGGRARREALRRIESGEARVVVGTHALIQKGVRFARLGLAVIDEQHKFGVLQRKTLLEKGYHPDVLVMTATPIPRTLAMTVYGDLDVSVIDQLPPGRMPVRTLLFREAERRRAYRLLEDEVRAGRQGYLVYPLVEESEKVDLQAAIQAAERLQARELKAFRVGLLHGRMKAEEKERTMAAFKSGEVQILVATTVVEVGVDVPNATVMLIEHAERFGLAQLHQLRGRVGRGGNQSWCLLLMSGRARRMEEGRAEAKPAAPPGSGGQPARQRLEALVASGDGFVIAEEDLRIRGPGEFFGVRQWGAPEFRAANLLRDAALLDRARREAFALVAADPALARPEHRALRAAMLRRWREKLALGSVS